MLSDVLEEENILYCDRINTDNDFSNKAAGLQSGYSESPSPY